MYMVGVERVALSPDRLRVCYAKLLTLHATGFLIYVIKGERGTGIRFDYAKTQTYTLRSMRFALDSNRDVFTFVIKNTIPHFPPKQTKIMKKRKLKVVWKAYETLPIQYKNFRIISGWKSGYHIQDMTTGLSHPKNYSTIALAKAAITREHSKIHREFEKVILESK